MENPQAIIKSEDSGVSLQEYCKPNGDEEVNPIDEKTNSEEKYFICDSCTFKETYTYFGRQPPFTKNYTFTEDSYVIEDPFEPPKKGHFIIYGAHCTSCGKPVCKDIHCSFYYGVTYCITCAKNSNQFPKSIAEKISKIN